MVAGRLGKGRSPHFVFYASKSRKFDMCMGTGKNFGLPRPEAPCTGGILRPLSRSRYPANCRNIFFKESATGRGIARTCTILLINFDGCTYSYAPACVWSPWRTVCLDTSKTARQDSSQLGHNDNPAVIEPYAFNTKIATASTTHNQPQYNE
jgi:hypothetical protein